MKMVKSTLAVLTTAAVLGVSGFAHAGATLDAVKKKGFVQCGISDGLPGFSYADAKGNYLGIDVDVCRAVAAAVFGDASKVKYSPLTAKERFTALQSGEVDMLSRNTTWTSSRDAAMGLNFTGVTYYDGQGFLVNKKLGVSSAKELDGATVPILYEGRTADGLVKNASSLDQLFEDLFRDYTQAELAVIKAKYATEPSVVTTSCFSTGS